MDFLAFKALTIPEGVVKKIESNGVVLWEEPASFKNWVQFSTESDGVTIYNGGLGYKNGYRVRSGGAEGASTTSVCTGFIPCKQGDIIRVIPPEAEHTVEPNYFNFSNASRTNIGQLAFNGQYGIFQNSGYTWSNVENINGVWAFTVPTDITSANEIAFVRITLGFGQSSEVTGNGMIVTINEEITD